MQTVDAMRNDISIRTKKGLPFILASIVIWSLIALVWILPIEDILTRNLFTFFAVGPLMPLAFGISKLIGAEFGAKGNPLDGLGLLFSMNQVLYILIAMWAYNAYPSRMVMILAIIFGAHLLPFGWLYQSRAYTLFAILIPVVALLVGAGLAPTALYSIPVIMVVLEIILSCLLFLEVRVLTKSS